MTPNRLIDKVGRPGGPLADASLWHLEVIETGAITPNLHRVVLTAPDLEGLTFRAGQDLMLRIPQSGESIVNRRYTIRRFDPAVPSVTIDVSLHAAGPGTDWIRAATVGSRIDGIAPRGKIFPRPDAAWHLFVADETGLPGALAMMESLAPGSVALALLEIDTAAEEQEPEASHLQRLDIRWLHRLGRTAPGDSSLFLEAIATTDIPSGTGCAYVSAELRVVRAAREALIERGIPPEQIASKAYWRRGLPNAEHGEPIKED
jgi:NADPH-dependent ferric siderophore reductase